tara:strand:- start:16806 stop:17738 length:933 start_codon:yes stop_codon:yes gene_type:complete
MNKLLILTRREFWEHRGTFLILPAVVTSVFIGILVIMLLGLSSNSIEVNIDADWETDNQTHELRVQDSSLMDVFGMKMAELASMPDALREDRLDQLFVGMSVIWVGVLWVVIIFYLLGALYDDRKDRSVLFWKSMPVSDAMTVASKLVAGLVLAPMIYLAFIVVAHLSLAIAATIGASGQEFSMWDTLWASANFFTRWAGFLALYVFTVLWCLPFFGWLLFVSAWAKSAPMVWAVGVPMVLVIVEGMFFSSSYLGQFFVEHMLSIEFWRQGREVIGNFELPAALEFGSSLVVGMLLIGAAVWQRSKADEI